MSWAKATKPARATLLVDIAATRKVGATGARNEGSGPPLWTPESWRLLGSHGSMSSRS
jgi:hypothetical protein